MEIKVCRGGGTSAGSTHSVIISKDARFSCRTLPSVFTATEDDGCLGDDRPPSDEGECNFNSFAFAVLNPPHHTMSTCGVTGLGILKMVGVLIGR